MFIDMNDIRLDAMEKATLLNICEQDASSKVAQKGLAPVKIGDGKFIAMSSNHVARAARESMRGPNQTRTR